MMQSRHSKKAPTRDYWLSVCISQVVLNSSNDDAHFNAAVDAARKNASRHRFNSEQTAKLEDAIADRVAYRKAQGIAA